MSRSQLDGAEQIQAGTIIRGDLNTTTTGSAVIAKIIAGTALTIASTGIDAGTGDVTINVGTIPIANGGTGQTSAAAALAALGGAPLAGPTFTGIVTLPASPRILGSSTGYTALTSANASATNYTITIPAATDTLVTLAATQTLTNKTLTSPTLVTPALDTPASGVLTNTTGLPLTTGVTGTLSVLNGGTGVTTSTGTGSVVLSTSPNLVTPALGTPTSGVLTNATGLPLTTGVTGILPVANGGTGINQVTSLRQAAYWATTAALPANTYSNGTSGVGATLTATAVGVLTIDSNTPNLGDRILVKNEATGANNGIYTLTTVGSASVAYVLTRATDSNTTVNVQNQIVSIVSGTLNAGTAWIVSTPTGITIGTTSITYKRLSTVSNATLNVGVTNTVASGTTVSATTATYTAPCNGNLNILIIGEASVATTTSASCTATLGSVTTIVSSASSNYGIVGSYNLPMTQGQATTVTGTVTTSTTGKVNVFVITNFIPSGA